MYCYGELCSREVLEVSVKCFDYDKSDSLLFDKMNDQLFLQHWEVQHTVELIKSKGFKRVALQFPDSLLAQSPRVASDVQTGLGPDYQV